jgi:ABC-type transport system substrate-binding protein
MITPVGRFASDKQVVEAVRAYLQEVGVKTELQVYDWPTIMTMLTKPLDKTEIELYLGGWGPPYLDADVALLMLFSSSAHPPRSLGATFYTNPDFDRLVGMARQILDPAKRKDLYKQASELLWDEAPCIWLHVEPYTIAYRSDLKGVVILPVERMFPTYVTKD